MAPLCLYTPDVSNVPGIHQVVWSARRACAPAMSPWERAAKKARTSCVLSVTSIAYLPHPGGSRHLCTGETIACQSASVHRRQDHIVQDVRGQRTLEWTRIQTGRQHDDEVNGGNHEDTLSAESETGGPIDLALVHQRAAHPHLVAIEVGSCTLDLRRCRFVQIVAGDDLPTLPEAVRQHQLAELGHVAGAQAQAPRRGGVAVRIVHPLDL